MYKKLFKDVVEYSERITLKINEKAFNDIDVKELNYYEYLKLINEIVWYKNRINNIEISVFGEKEVIKMPQNHLINLRVQIKKYFEDMSILYELSTNFDYIEVTYPKGDIEYQEIYLEVLKKSKGEKDYPTITNSFLLFNTGDVLKLMQKYNLKKSTTKQKWKYGGKKELYIKEE